MHEFAQTVMALYIDDSPIFRAVVLHREVSGLLESVLGPAISAARITKNLEE